MLPARVPSREAVRRELCPRCGARPGEPCWAEPDYAVERRNRHGRPSNHAERVQVAQRWLGQQLELS